MHCLEGGGRPSAGGQGYKVRPFFTMLVIDRNDAGDPRDIAEPALQVGWSRLQRLLIKVLRLSWIKSRRLTDMLLFRLRGDEQPQVRGEDAYQGGEGEDIRWRSG